MHASQVVFGAVEALGSLFVAALFALAAAALLNLGLGVSMPWYSRPYFMFLLYGLPAILGTKHLTMHHPPTR